jgi:AraC-like DNA-binding protein
MLYWYVRSILTDDSKMKGSDGWHFVPMVLYFIAALPEVFLSWNEKVELARRAAEDTAFVGQYPATLLARVVPQVWIFAGRLILILGYTLWSVYLLIRYIRKNKLSAVFSRQHFVKKYMLFLLGFLLVVLLTQIPMVFKSFQMHFSELYLALKIIQGISLAGLIGLLISPFFFPSILYGLPRIPDPEPPTDQAKTEMQPEPKIVRQAGSAFETDYLKNIENQVIHCMAEHKPYIKSECNLYSFSKLIDVPTHHLAYYFREFKGQRFNDFRNKWRVDHAKSLIQEGKASEITLEAIGLLSGFSSRNAFITDFKKFEGESPGSYASRFN